MVLIMGSGWTAAPCLVTFASSRSLDLDTRDLPHRAGVEFLISQIGIAVEIINDEERSLVANRQILAVALERQHDLVLLGVGERQLGAIVVQGDDDEAIA